ncbi:MAG TPA: hypothetical protein VNQ76_15725 [Planctomicrobium sp.]|nr:hypothetical protein [Planctomicrobium sp.]
MGICKCTCSDHRDCTFVSDEHRPVNILPSMNDEGTFVVDSCLSLNYNWNGDEEFSGFIHALYCNETDDCQHADDVFENMSLLEMVKSIRDDHTGSEGTSIEFFNALNNFINDLVEVKNEIVVEK